MKIFKSLFCFFLLFISTNVGVYAQTKVSAIKAKLFYNENKDGDESKDVSGGFSENIIDNSEIVLWNTLIGEGSAEGYSNQTIVIVEIASKGQSNKNQLVKFTATVGKKVILQQLRTFSVISDSTKFNLLFLLNNTGCEEIAVTAEIIKNNKPVSILKKKINFKCGE